MTKGLSFLKEGLTPSEKARITKAFNRAVNEKLKIELAAIMEAQVKGIVRKTKKSLNETVRGVAIVTNAETKIEVKKVSENLGKYIDFLIGESLPKSLVETAGRALRYSDMLEKIEESVKGRLQKEARMSNKEEFNQLREDKRIAEEKHKKLFERMVDDANKAIIIKRRGIARKLIEQLPDREAKIVSKIVISNIDFSAMDNKTIPIKINEIHESVVKALKNNKNTKKINEVGKGNLLQPQINNDIIQLDEDVTDALDFMKNTTWNRG